jgi:hypothetical protein
MTAELRSIRMPAIAHSSTSECSEEDKCAEELQYHTLPARRLAFALKTQLLALGPSATGMPKTRADQS